VSRRQAITWDSLNALTGGGVVSQIDPNLRRQRAAKPHTLVTAGAVGVPAGAPAGSLSAAESSSILVQGWYGGSSTSAVVPISQPIGIVFMDDGVIVEEGPPGKVLDHLRRSARGALLSCVFGGSATLKQSKCQRSEGRYTPSIGE
jgi:hypothetical protein